MPKPRNLPDRALLIRPPAIDDVLAGTKTWEIRSRSTNLRGSIGLIRSGSGTVVGTCELVDVIGPLRYGEYRRNARKWGGKPSEVSRADHLQFYCVGAAEGEAVPLARRLPPSERGDHLGAVDWEGVEIADATRPRPTETGAPSPECLHDWGKPVRCGEESRRIRICCKLLI